MERYPSLRAIGSSYLIRQSPGSERLGGLRITLYPRYDNNGEINVLLTDWHSGEPHEYPLPECADIAVDAIRAFAIENNFDLSAFDIKLSHFVFHDVDSDPRCYAQAARSALKSAIEALTGKDFISINSKM